MRIFLVTDDTERRIPLVEIYRMIPNDALRVGAMLFFAKWMIPRFSLEDSEVFVGLLVCVGTILDSSRFFIPPEGWRRNVEWGKRLHMVLQTI